MLHEPVLHHYDPSPFSEKVRLMLGLKGLAWRSVIVPMVLPKPLLMPLTGGFRHTPVLQIGADVYCDTLGIALELERRWPQPSLFPEGRGGLGAILAQWAEGPLFGSTARFVTGQFAGHLPGGLHADRAAMRGHAAPDPAHLPEIARLAREQMHPQLRWVEQLLADGRPFLLGARIALTDFALYGRAWWLAALDARGGEELRPYPGLRGWMERVAACGHGQTSELSPEGALAIARDAEPAALPAAPWCAAHLYPGQTVQVGTEGFAADPVTGELVAIEEETLTLRRLDPRAGTVHVHFPRVGYDLSPLGASA